MPSALISATASGGPWLMMTSSRSGWLARILDSASRYTPRSRGLYSDSASSRTSVLPLASFCDAVSILSRMSGRADICADRIHRVAVPAVGTASRIRALVAFSKFAASSCRPQPIASAIMMPNPPEAATSVTASSGAAGVPRPAGQAAWPTSSSSSKGAREHAIATEDGIEDRVRARQRAGVRGRSGLAAAPWNRS